MNAQVLELRPAPPRRHLPDKRRSPNLYALKQDVPEGYCLICELRLPPSTGKKPRTDLCGSLECKRAYDITCWLDSQHRQKSRARRHLRNLASR